MARRNRCLSTSITVALVSLWCAEARAQPSAARCPGMNAAIELALREREANHTAAALAVLEDLHARCPAPQVLAQLALAETDAGRLHHAWRHLQEALTSTTDPWIRTRRAALLVARTELRGRMASLTVHGAPPGATLYVDGERLGDAHASEPYVVAPGTVHIELRAPGFRVAQRGVSATPGQDLALDMPMTPEAPPTAVSPRTVGVAPPLTAPRSSSTARYFGYALLGVGGAAAVTGAVFAVLTMTGASTLQSATASTPGNEGAFVRFVTSPGYVATDRSVETACTTAATDGSADGRAAADLCASHDRARVLAWALGLGGLVVAGVGAALVIVRPGETQIASLRVAPVLGEASGVMLHGAF